MDEQQVEGQRDLQVDVTIGQREGQYSQIKDEKSAEEELRLWREIYGQED